MPTPFTHLAYAQRLLSEPGLPPTARALLHAHRPAFWLGSIAADVQTISALRREDTHFYHYERPMTEHPYRVMLARYPSMRAPAEDAARAFVAGYTAHLAMDELWSQHMIGPYFAREDWGPREVRFLALQLVLIVMDERDRAGLDAALAEELGRAAPAGWAPFVGDAHLAEWRDMIARQLAPGGQSETLAVVSSRSPAGMPLTPGRLRAMLDSPQRMARLLWNHVPPAALHEAEQRMFAAAREQLVDVLAQ